MAVAPAEDGERPRPKALPAAAAIALHERFGVVEPWDIDVELMAAELGAYVLYRDVASADARVVRSHERAYFVVKRGAEGSPRARFSIAHELGHLVLHPGVDGIDRMHGRPRERHEFPLEAEANAFSAELLLPARQLLFVRDVASPTLDHLRRTARAFTTSLTATARRWAKLSPAPCALVESRAGRITRVTRSVTFRSRIAKDHAVPATACAYAIGRGEKREAVAERARGGWGSAKRRAVREESIAIAGTDAVLSWLWQEVQEG